MEWQSYKDSLCSGCGNPRAESFDPANEERYDAVALTCFPCAERERERRRMSHNPDGVPPPPGVYIAVSGPHLD